MHGCPALATCRRGAPYARHPLLADTHVQGGGVAWGWLAEHVAEVIAAYSGAGVTTSIVCSEIQAALARYIDDVATSQTSALAHAVSRSQLSLTAVLDLSISALTPLHASSAPHSPLLPQYLLAHVSDHVASESPARITMLLHPRVAKVCTLLPSLFPPVEQAPSFKHQSLRMLATGCRLTTRSSGALG